MIYLAEFILVLPITILWARRHAHLADDNRTILHGLWAALYIALIAVAVFVWPIVARVGQIAAFAGSCLVGRLIVFNIAMNRFRGLPWSYLGTKAWTDKIERRLFGARVWLAEAVLSVVFIILQFFIK